MTAQWLLVSELDGLAEGYRVRAVLEPGDHPAHTATGEIIVSRSGLVGTAFELPGTDDIIEPSGCYWVITAGSKQWQITLPDSLASSQGSPVLVGYPPIQRAVGAPPPSWPAGALPGPGGTTGQAWGKRSNADNDTGWITVSGGPGGAVDSVNAKTGAVVLTATDVGADAAGAAAAATAAAAQKAANLSDLASASTARTNLNLGTAALAAAGDFDAAGAAAAATSTAAQRASNLSDLASASTARTNLGLGTAATADKVAAGSAGVLDATDATTTNARTPTSHAASHASAGSDPVTLAESQVTNLTSDLAAKVAKAGSATTLWAGTAAAYAAIGTKDANTVYVVLP